MSTNETVRSAIKGVASLLICVGMFYSPTYYADQPMQSNYAWVWSILILYAIWTRKRHRIIKSIASFGPGVFGMGALISLVTARVHWVIPLGLLAISILLLVAIWLRRSVEETVDFEKEVPVCSVDMVPSVETQNDPQIDDKYFCSHCGKPIDRHHKFCIHCGAENVMYGENQ